MCILQVMDTLGSAAFSRAVQALDIKTGALVCLKIIKVSRLLRAERGAVGTTCVHHPQQHLCLAACILGASYCKNDVSELPEGLLSAVLPAAEQQGLL